MRQVSVLQEARNGVNRQPSNGLKFNRRPTKKVIFTVNRQKCRLIITINKFPDISNLTISADLHGPLAPEEFLNWKSQFSCSQKHSPLTLQKLATCLYLRLFRNFIGERPRQPQKHNS